METKPPASTAGPRSQTLYAQALRRLPGGVNSPVRAFRAVGGTPIFVQRGDGCFVDDVDGRRYIDYVQSWGALILGHAHPAVVDAVCRAAAAGTSFGMPTAAEVELAELLTAAIPSMEMVRLVNSGTEAVMSALRLARAATGRRRVVKFAGCYHGHADAMLARAGSGAALEPSTRGVSPGAVAETLLARYNHVEDVEALFADYGPEIAAVVVEPVAGNMGVVTPQPGFLEALRALTRRHGSLLIFDEVITGFRVGWGGAQARYGVTPDLTCLGKIIGGGLPVGAYGGPRTLMEQVSPAGPVYQAGTLAGNPVAVAAGLATLHELQRPGVYETLEQTARRLAEGLRAAAGGTGVDLSVTQVGGMLGLSFRPDAPRDFDQAQAADAARFGQFFHEMLRRGVHLAPAMLEAAFVGLAHGPAAIDETLAAARASLSVIAAGGA